MPRAAVYPKGLSPRGKRLWKDVLDVRPRLGPGERVLLEEACRLADRLEWLNDVIGGRKLPQFDTKDGKRFVIVVDAAQQEARLSTVALRQVLMSLGLDRMVVPQEPAAGEPEPRKAGSGKVPAEPGEETPKEGDPIDVLTARRTAREAAVRESGA